MLGIAARISSRLDTLVALLGILLSIIILYLSYGPFNINQEHIGFAVLIASLAYVVLRKRLLSTSIKEMYFTPSRSLALVNHIVFVSCFTASIWLFYANLYVRPLAYFVLITICCASIALEILYSKEGKIPWLVIFKIVLIGINLQAGIYYEFPGPLGVDTWYHQGWIQKWIHYGHVVPGSPFTLDISGESGYYTSPIFHLSVIANHFVTSLSIKNSYFLVGFCHIMCTIFIFLIGRHLRNTKFALLAMLLINICAYHIHYVTEIMPMTLGFSVFLIIFYLILTGKPDVTTRGLFLFLSIVLILTHSIAAFTMLIALGVFYGVRVLYSRLNLQNNRAVIDISTLGFFSVAMLSQWLRECPISGESFFDMLVKVFAGSLQAHAGFGATEYVATPALSLSYVLNTLGWLLFFCAGLVGLMLWLSKEKQSMQKLSLSLLLLTFLASTYGFPLFGLQTIIPGRWFVPISFILALMASEGILRFSLAAPLRSLRAKRAIALILVIGLSFFMMTSTIASSNSLYGAGGGRVAYTQSELQAIGKLPALYDGKVVTDYMYTLDRLTRAGRETEFLSPSKFHYEGLIILRSLIFDEGLYVQKSFGITEGPYALGDDFRAQFDNPQFDLIYHNGQVRAYITDYY